MKNIFSVLIVAFLLYIFTFYVDGEMGMILLAFLLAAPLISLVFVLYGRKHISVSFNCDAYVKKDSELQVKIVIEKDTSFPIPIISIFPCSSLNFKQENKKYKLSLLTEKKVTFTCDFLAMIGGNGEVSIDSVYLCGFLGFIKLKLLTKLPEPKSVGIIPEIPDVKSSSQLFRNIADAVMTSDDDEENDTAMLFSANTFPGYEHREYVVGDSMKRVNWKLSSKVSKLMVRLDEASSAVQPSIFLDIFRENNTIVSLKREEKLLQSVFGLLSLLIKQGIACLFSYRSFDGEIITESVDNPDYPAQLLLKVLAVKPNLKEHINITNLSDNLCACIIATTDISSGFSNVLEKIPDKENVCIIVPDSESKQKIQIPVWFLSEDNNFKLV